MDRLPVISGRVCVMALQRAGFRVDRQKGSHVMMVRLQPSVCTISVPQHKELAKGTLRAIIKQANMTVGEFVTLLG